MNLFIDDAVASAGGAWNPADGSSNIAAFTFTDADATATKPSSGNVTVRNTTAKTSGKWYFEIFCTSQGTDREQSFYGVIDATVTMADFWQSLTRNICRRSSGAVFSNGINYEYSGSSITNTGDTIGFACDVGNTVKTYSNNVLEGTATYSESSIKIFCNAFTAATGQSMTLRTTSSSQVYTPPTGYTAWG